MSDMADERPVYIYALCDPRDDSVRYIGQTINPEGRLALHHARELSSWKKDAWVRELRTAKLRPYMRILDVVARAEAARVERLAMARHVAMGCDLTNSVLGPQAKADEERVMLVAGKVTGRVYNAVVDLAWAEGWSLGEAMGQLVAEAIAARAQAAAARQTGAIMVGAVR